MNACHWTLAGVIYLVTSSAAAVTPGGMGVIHYNGILDRCYSARSDHAMRVCGPVDIGWSLKIENDQPVGNYSLRWRLEAVVIDSGHGARVHLLEDLPAELAAAGLQSTLTIKGVLSDRTGSVGFDTGVPVAPGDDAPGMSVKYHWDQFWIVQPAPGTNWCSLKGRGYAPALFARQRMARGIRLHTLRPCLDSVADASILEDALKRFCQLSTDKRREMLCKTPLIDD